MKCTRVIIPVAGYGTRRLPVSKSVEKCMLPILNRPVIDYVVQDCIRAGMTEIIFVVGTDSAQLRSYYTHNPALESYLKDTGKADLIPLVSPPQGVKFRYIEQDQNGKYGTAVPVALCRELVPAGESTLVCMGDDCLYYPDETSSDLRRLMQHSVDKSGMLAVEVPHETVSGYGVLELDEQDHFVRIAEKPRLEDAPSNLINVSKYLFTSELLDEVAHYVDQENVRGEYQITDPINRYVQKGGAVKVVAAKGTFLDAGTVDGWLQANLYVSANS